MCGIIGYIGKEQALPFLMEGLRRESYRGYDSSGIAVFDGEKINLVKSVGKLEKLQEKLQKESLPGTLGIGHNRWATHGNVTEENAHPHVDCGGNIFLVHNGIVENYRELKEMLQQKGHVFSTQTDTEVLAHLVEHFFEGDLQKAVRQTLALVRGSYGVAVIAKQAPQTMVVARLSSPMVVSQNGQGVLVASDPAAMVGYAKQMVFLDDNEIAVLTPEGFTVNGADNLPKEKELTAIAGSVAQAQKDGFDHFMLKEIFQQPESIASVLNGRLSPETLEVKLGGLEDVKQELAQMENVHIVACGTASFAGRVGEYVLEELAGLPTKVDIASEFRYKQPIINKKTLYVFVSQSGETADTLGALQEVKQKGGLTLGIVNVVGSTLARQVGVGMYTYSGPEIAVASTKAFTGQVAALVLLALFLGRQRQLSLARAKEVARELLGVPQLVQNMLEHHVAIKALAQKYTNIEHIWFTGRNSQYPVALEGALKLKEVAYVHAEGIAGGELKHGSIALIRPDFPTLAICPEGSVYEKMLSNIQEIKAREGKVIAIATEGDSKITTLADDVIFIPKTLELLQPLLAVIPLQLFAYYMAVQHGLDVDKPRNLAKSVTVE